MDEAGVRELQEALAAAIARIEGERIRAKRLQEENVLLRNVLRQHGINPGKASSALLDDQPAGARNADAETQTAQTEHDYPARLLIDGTEVRAPGLDHTARVFTQTCHRQVRAHAIQHGIRGHARAGV